MTWVPTEKEIADVLRADGEHRLEYFIHRVCEARALWALFDDGWASYPDDDGTPLILLWPHQVFAQPYAAGSWAAFTPRRIPLDEFLETWIDGMRRANTKPALFPVPSGNSIIVTLDELEAGLRQELSEVYGVDR